MKTQSSTNSVHLTSKISILLALILIGLGAGTQAVRADMGAKPTMEFEFVYESGATLTISEGIQLECSDDTCSDAQPLEEAGPQRFTCTDTTCSSMAYGYKDYHRLVISFSDGVTRESNVFDKSHFSANYRVTVRENDLLVEETGGSMNPLNLLLWGGCGVTIIAGALVVTLLGILIFLIVRAGREQVSFETSRWLFVVIWIIMLPFFVVGSFISLTLPLTVIVEGIIVLIYAHVRKHSRATLLTLVTLANLISQPALYFFLTIRADGVNFVFLGLIECCIWLLEAVLLYASQRKTLSFGESLKLSALLNVVSFAIGLLLPV